MYVWYVCMGVYMYVHTYLHVQSSYAYCVYMYCMCMYTCMYRIEQNFGGEKTLANLANRYNSPSFFRQYSR